jgi:hypothetical protein
MSDGPCHLVAREGELSRVHATIFRRMVKMRFGTDEFGTGEIGTDGLVNLRLVKPSCAG